MYPNKREIKDADLCCWQSKKNFGGAGGGEAIIKIDCNKKSIFNQKIQGHRDFCHRIDCNFFWEEGKHCLGIKKERFLLETQSLQCGGLGMSPWKEELNQQANTKLHILICILTHNC